MRNLELTGLDLGDDLVLLLGDLGVHHASDDDADDLDASKSPEDRIVGADDVTGECRDVRGEEPSATGGNEGTGDALAGVLGAEHVRSGGHVHRSGTAAAEVDQDDGDDGADSAEAEHCREQAQGDAHADVVEAQGAPSGVELVDDLAPAKTADRVGDGAEGDGRCDELHDISEGCVSSSSFLHDRGEVHRGAHVYEACQEDADEHDPELVGLDDLSEGHREQVAELGEADLCFAGLLSFLLLSEALLPSRRSPARGRGGEGEEAKYEVTDHAEDHEDHEALADTDLRNDGGSERGNPDGSQGRAQVVDCDVEAQVIRVPLGNGCGDGTRGGASAHADADGAEDPPDLAATLPHGVVLDLEHAQHGEEVPAGVHEEVDLGAELVQQRAAQQRAEGHAKTTNDGGADSERRYGVHTELLLQQRVEDGVSGGDDGQQGYDCTRPGQYLAAFLTESESPKRHILWHTFRAEPCNFNVYGSVLIHLFPLFCSGRDKKMERTVLRFIPQLLSL